MKVTLKIYESFGDTGHTVLIDGKHFATVESLRESPEDAIIGRDLLDGYDIINAIKKAWTTGKDGQELEVEVIEVPGSDDGF